MLDLLKNMLHIVVILFRGDAMSKIQEMMAKREQAIMAEALSVIADKIPPTPLQDEIMALITDACGIAIVQDKGVAFSVLGPRMATSDGCFISRDKNPRFSVDIIAMNANANSPYWFSVLFHELAHATGAKGRLNREGITMRASWTQAKYDYEEVIAETVARNIMDGLGLATDDTRKRSAKYIANYEKDIVDSIDVETFQDEVERAENMVLGWIKGIDFKA